MSAKIIDGKAISAEIRGELKSRVDALKARGITPGLAVILVGEDPASQVYVRNKELACHEIGVYSEVCRLGADTTREELLSIIDDLNSRAEINGILVQLPLPAHLDPSEIITRISPDKDVDGFHTESAGRLLTGINGFVACTPKGIIRLIKSTGTDIEGKRAVVVGRSNIVGKPVSILLLNENATVTMCHSRTKELRAVCREADILVAAIGKAGFFTGDYIKPGAVVIDVGTNRVDGKLVGDVVFDEAKEIAAYITPVPGGVGPMTITMLLANTVEAAERA